MSERNDYAPGVPCWVDTAQQDPDAARRFYEELFGWESVGPGAVPGDPPGRYFVARLRGRDVAGISSQPGDGAPPDPVWSTYIYVDSADDATEQVKRAGGAIVVAPFDALPAGRMAVVTDPAGATFCLWEPKDRKGAQLVNEAGAWSISILNTPDPESAKAFYGAVFGWETDPAEPSESDITLFRLPGYVGGEPQQPVPRDVIAAMTPARGTPSAGDATAQWSVNFWVGDADGTADKAADLGGAIVVAPFDTPAFRNAILADPAGAVFSVSRVPGP
jgi:predicted enzyme related to lactoylglutathione lyase